MEMNFVPAISDGAGMRMKILGGDEDGGNYIRICPSPLTFLMVQIKLDLIEMQAGHVWAVYTLTILPIRSDRAKLQVEFSC